ncbi:MAG: RecQ family ATP-dependent DNA helicase [Symbiobacteriia bacterium]
MDQIDQALKDTFNHAEFRPLQREAVEAVLAGRSVLAVFATGGGKSLCYQLAGHLLPGVTLVFSPLVSLMKDQSETELAQRLGLTTINGHTSPSEVAARLEGLAAGHYKLLLVSPERLRQRTFVKAMEALKVSLLVVDEAHCLSEWGHDFRPDYRLIRSFREAIGKPPVMALTATATPQVRRDIKTQLGIADALELVGSADRPNLTISVHRLMSEREKQQEVVLAVTAAVRAESSAIVYVPTTREAERLAGELSEQLRVQVLAYHGKQPAAVRNHVQESFMGGLVPVVVATNAFGMGLDKPNVRLVVHSGVPGSLEAYYQEIGRAGRDGRPARAILFYTKKDVEFRQWLVEAGRTGPDDVRRLLSALQAGKPLPETAKPRAAKQARGKSAGRAVPARAGSARPGFERTERAVSAPPAREEAEGTKQRAVLTELELQGVIRRQAQSPAGYRLLVTDEAGLEAAVLRAGTLLDRLYRRRLAKFKVMEEYLTTSRCRREFVLRYFGEKLKTRPAPCCDRCQQAAGTALVGGMPRLTSGTVPTRYKKTLATKTGVRQVGIARDAAEPGGTRRVAVRRGSAAAGAAAAGLAGEADGLGMAGSPELARIVKAGKDRDRSAVVWLVEELKGDTEDRLLAAATALGRIKDPQGEAPLRHLLTDPRPMVQQHAILALGELGQSLETALALEILQASQAGLVQRAAGEALARVRRRTKAAARTGVPGRYSR